MKQRCFNQKNENWPDYGGRGIRVCSRWRVSFVAFLEDVGRRPSPRASLDRIDNDGHYSCGRCDECERNGWPLNARWASAAVQANNRRTTISVTYDGTTLPLSEWCRRLHLKYHTTHQRLAKGWSVDRAFTQPAQQRNPRRTPANRLYSLWCNFNRRCHDPKHKSFPSYGAKGVRVCERWRKSYLAFAADMRPRPEDATLDRIDNGGGYWCGKPECPECGPAGRVPNCRWATRKEQSANRGPFSPRVCNIPRNLTA